MVSNPTAKLFSGWHSEFLLLEKVLNLFH
jgi:hypothetical protein